VGVLNAFLAIVLGSMLGSSVLYFIARHYGQPFVHRYGPYMHVHPDRLNMVERWFDRYGFWVIIAGRHVPGLRMVISVFAGLFGVRWSTFLVSVAISSSIWAALFLAIGIRLDRQLGPYMTITPLHLLPSTLFIGGSVAYAFVLRRRALRAERTAAMRIAEQISS
jgi:membrane protein DedA with SNARE-associated domain